MFNFIKKNKNKEKLNLIQLFREIQKSCEVRKLNKASIVINEIIYDLDETLLEIDTEVINEIKYTCNMIKGSLSNKYEEYLLYKLNYIKSIISGGNIIKNNAYLENEENMYKTIGDIHELQKESKNYDNLMDKYLGKDRHLWCKYKSMKDLCEKKILIKNKNYQSMLKNAMNIALQEETNGATMDATTIDGLSTIIDKEEFMANVDYINDVEEEVGNTNEQFVEKINGSFTTDLDDYDYDRALESKRFKESVSDNLISDNVVE